MFPVLLFVMFGLFSYAQNELYVINKAKEADQRRIFKGSFLRITTTSGEKYSGTLIKVKDSEIVLMAYDASIDIEEIISIKIVHQSTWSVDFTQSSIYVSGNKYRKFDMQYWRLLIKNE